MWQLLQGFPKPVRTSRKGSCIPTKLLQVYSLLFRHFAGVTVLASS